MTSQDRAGTSFATELHECANCGGHFPGEGIVREDRTYCTDLCADADTRRRAFLTNPYVIGGAFLLGVLLGSRIIGFRTLLNTAMFAEKYRLRDYLMPSL